MPLSAVRSDSFFDFGQNLPQGDWQAGPDRCAFMEMIGKCCQIPVVGGVIPTEDHFSGGCLPVEGVVPLSGVEKFPGVERRAVRTSNPRTTGLSSSERKIPMADLGDLAFHGFEGRGETAVLEPCVIEGGVLGLSGAQTLP